MKKLKVMFIAGVIGCMALTACGGKEAAGTGSTETEAEAKTEGASTESSDEGLVESKIEEFEYSTLDDGTITITEYHGEASLINVPEEIDGIKVTCIDGIGSDSMVKLVIPDSVTTIGDGAFMFSRNLQEVVMSKNVTTIGPKAFEGATELTTINIPDCVSEIGEYAFACTSITTMTIPSKLTEINNSLFSGSELENITIPGNIKTVGDSAFEDCKELKEVTIEDGVEKIEEDAFWNNESLTKIELPSSLTDMASWDFPDECTIIAPAGSYAETLAKENGYNFQAK